MLSVYRKLALIVAIGLLGPGPGCDDGPPTNETAVEALGASDEVRRTSPGQNVEPVPSRDELIVIAASTGAATGSSTDIDDKAMSLMVGVAEAMRAGLPDARAALDGVAAHIKETETTASAVGESLRTAKSEATKAQRADWVEVNEERYRQETLAWQEVMAEFEHVATDAEIIELNALLKSYTASMRAE